MDVFELFGFGAKGWGGALLEAALMTLLVTLSALLIGAVFGSLVAWGKLSKSVPAKVAGDLYTTLFRCIPELLVIYLIYFGGSSLMTAMHHSLGGEGFFGMPPFLSGAFAVGVISGSYQAEVYRGAFHAVSRGEIEAARAMGMPRLKLFFRIIMPQVMRFALPGLGNVWQMTLKDSALISVTGLAEILRTSQVGASSTHQYFQFFIIGGVLYLVMTSISNRFFNAAEARVGKSFRRAIG
ncbi:ABC transporter permease [Leeia oryzae]|uniref:ABC transporter permease n=1 Tax=Leeia oryzae TaxID=356662 RepID=UPI0003811656|nr:ABC transporter permease subunit [Leeia oryzae]